MFYTNRFVMNLTREPMSFTLMRARISHHCFTRADGRIDNELINAPLDWLATTLNKSSLLYPGNITNHFFFNKIAIQGTPQMAVD